MTKKILIDEAVVKQALEALSASRICYDAHVALVRCEAPLASAERSRLELRAEEASHNEKLAHAAADNALREALAEQQAAEPVGEYVIVGRAELAMVRNALQRDADEGKQSRKAMLRALDESARPAQSHQPLTDDELRNVLRNTNHMIRNAMHGPFWPELEQACRAIEAVHGITSTNQGD